MGISKSAVKKLMQSQTDKQISDDAVYTMIDRLESMVKEYTHKSEQILDDENKIRDIQKLRRKKRISKEEIRQAWT
jgi:hypothetical protein